MFESIYLEGIQVSIIIISFVFRSRNYYIKILVVKFSVALKC